MLSGGSSRAHRYLIENPPLKMQSLRLLKDKVYAKIMLVFTIVSVSVVLVIGIGLYLKSVPVLNKLS